MFFAVVLVVLCAAAIDANAATPKKRQVTLTTDGQYFIIPLRADGRLFDSLTYAKGLPAKVLRRPADYFHALRSPDHNLINPVDYGRMKKLGYEHVLLPVNVTADNAATKALLGEARKRTKRSAADVLAAIGRMQVPSHGEIATAAPATKPRVAVQPDELIFEPVPKYRQDDQVVTKDDLEDMKAEELKGEGKDNALVEKTGNAPPVMELADEAHEHSAECNELVIITPYGNYPARFGEVKAFPLYVDEEVEIIRPCGEDFDIRVDYVDARIIHYDREEFLSVGARYKARMQNPVTTQAILDQRGRPTGQRTSDYFKPVNARLLFYRDSFRTGEPLSITFTVSHRSSLVPTKQTRP